MTDEVKGVVEDTSEFKTSNDRQMYAVTVNGEDYSDFGHVPDDVDKGQPVRIEYSVSGQYKNIEEIESISQDDLRAEAAGDADPRIAASKVVGQIFSENPPEDPKDMNMIYRMTQHFAEYHMTGSFPEDVEMALEANEAGVPDEVRDKIEKLSSRLGDIEQVDVSEKADQGDVSELADRLSEIEGQLEQLQAAVATATGEDEAEDEREDVDMTDEPGDPNARGHTAGDTSDGDQDVLFGEDEEDADEEG